MKGNIITYKAWRDTYVNTENEDNGFLFLTLKALLTEFRVCS
jgi:hypothetical protein